MELSGMSPVLNQMSLEESLAYLSSLGVDSLEIGAGGYPGKAHLDPKEYLANPEKIEEKTLIPSLIELLQLDPRPSYHDDPEREYGMSFAGYNIRFTVSEDILTVRSVTQHS